MKKNVYRTHWTYKNNVIVINKILSCECKAHFFFSELSKLLFLVYIFQFHI